MKKRARFITRYEDNPRGVYLRKVEKRKFHIIEWNDLIDCCGESEAKEIGGQYSIQLGEVDLDAIPSKDLDSAIQSCGWDVDTYSNSDLAEICFSYGLKSPLFDIVTNNLSKGMKEARKESLICENDLDHYENQMSRPVNSIGSTAREFGTGDIFSAMSRDVQQGSQSACIMAKMYGVPDDKILEAQTYEINSVPSNDPLAYLMGYQDGSKGCDKADPDEDTLASAYLEGYRVGSLVHSGDMPVPNWVK